MSDNERGLVMTPPQRNPWLFLLGIALLGFPATADSASLGLEVGQQYRFEAVHLEDLGAGLDPGPEDRPVIMPKAVEQTITVKAEESCEWGTCLVLESQQLILEDDGAEVHSEARALVQVSDGQIKAIDRTIREKNQRDSKSHAEPKTRNTVLDDFYGPWMLDLEDGFKKEFKLPGNRVRTYTVKGRETVMDRECFVVQRVTPHDGWTETTKYWIDVENRFTVQVEQDDWRLRLVEVKSAE